MLKYPNKSKTPQNFINIKLDKTIFFIRKFYPFISREDADELAEDEEFMD